MYPDFLSFSFSFDVEGFAFVHMDDEKDAEYAIRALDRSEFGRKGRRLRVEWTKVIYNFLLTHLFFWHILLQSLIWSICPSA